MNLVAWALLIALSLCWGSSYFFVAWALEGFSPAIYYFYKQVLAFTMLATVMIFSKHSLPRDWKLWGGFMVMGFFNNFLPGNLIAVGQTEISSGMASILNATTPIFTVILVMFIRPNDLDNRWAKVAGILIGFVGVAIMLYPEATGGMSPSVWAYAAILGAALSLAVAGLWGKRLSEVPNLVTVTCVIFCSMLQTFVYCLVDGDMLTFDVGWQPWAGLAGSALIATALAYSLYFVILKRSGPVFLLLATFLTPVVSIALGTLFLDEQLEMLIFVGMAVLFVGLIIIDGRLLKFLGKKIGDPMEYIHTTP